MSIRTWVASIVASCAVAGCASVAKPISPATTTPTAGSTSVRSDAFGLAVKVPPIVVDPVPCFTTIPVVVTTENRTTARGDLCAAFNRAIKILRNTRGLGVGRFAIHVTLSRLTVSSEAKCTLGIAVSSKSVALGETSGGATVENAPTTDRRLAGRNCVDTVLDELMTRKVYPLMQQQLAKVAGPTSPSSTPPPTP